MVVVRVKDGPHRGMTFPLKDQVIWIGRDPEASIPIMDQGVSRRHAEIFRVGEMYFIRDLGSRNGTFLNEEKVSEELLRAGDIIRIGKTVLSFEETSDSSATLEGVGTPIQFSTEDEADNPGATLEFKFGMYDLSDMAEPDIKDNMGARSRQSKYLSVIYQVSRILGSVRDSRELLRQVVQVCADATGAQHCYALIRAEGKKELTLGASFETKNAPQPVLSKVIIGRVFKSGRAILTPGAGVDGKFNDKMGVVIDKLKSVVCAPIVERDRVNGVIYLSNQQVSRAFSSEDVELITAIGIQTGVALSALKDAESQKEMFLKTITALVTAVEMREPHLKGRSERIARYAETCATVMNLPQEERDNLRVSALLYNIGRILISEAEVIKSQSATTREETIEYIQSIRSERLLREMGISEQIVSSVKHSFERFDGSGVPDGLRGEEIPLASRIIFACRLFDEFLAESVQSDGDNSVRDAFFKLNDSVKAGFTDETVVKTLAIAYRMGILLSDEQQIPVEPQEESGEPTEGE